MRKELVVKLNEFYNTFGIVPDESFNCPKMEECNKKGIKLAQGMQCHVGSKYGEKGVPKVMVVSLVCGDGGIETIVNRTNTIEGLINKNKINPHMRGTIDCISDVLKFENKKDSLKYYVMTNSCKCSREVGQTDQLPEFFYEQCAEYKINEIDLVKPDIIYLQGRRALIGLKFENIEGLSVQISEYLKYLVIGDKKYYAVQCIHPSARGRHAQRKKMFYNEIMPEINRLLTEKLG